MIDTHAHYNLEPLLTNALKTLQAMHDAGVDMAVVPGTNLLTSQSAIRLNEQFPSLKPAVGIHPSEAINIESKTLLNQVEGKLRSLLSIHKEIVAIGEIGLEEENYSQTQMELFLMQVNLAHEFNKPMILHVRGKSLYGQVFDVIEKNGNLLPFRGVMHCFVGDMSDLMKALDLGFYIGVNAIITYKSGEELRQVLKQAPLDRILLETDSPWLPPGPERKYPNTAANIPIIAIRLAEIMERPVSVVMEQTTANARNLFRIE